MAPGAARRSLRLKSKRPGITPAHSHGHEDGHLYFLALALTMRPPFA